MTNQEFDALVFKLEQHARQSPSKYQVQVLFLALFGNFYLGLMLLVVASILIASIALITVLKWVAIKLVIVVGVFLWMLIKALWVRIPAPTGFEIDAKQAPELFLMIAELRSALNSPQFHHVLVTDEFNAAVVQSPRFGIFGAYRNYLLIGLPLMKALTREQFKAVLAHEFGHLAKGHGRISNWIYRQRLRWSRLMVVLAETESRASFMFKPFFNWYSPYFNAYSFPLARANEYEADATSARLTSSKAAAQALTSVNVVGSYLGQRFWPQLHKQANEQPQPVFMPYASMHEHVSRVLDDSSVNAWLDEALSRKTTSDDTHPALTDRLGAIGESAELVPPVKGEAADQLLGAALRQITEEFDERWLTNILPSWQERFEEIKVGKKRLKALELANSESELSIDEAVERARLTDVISEDAEAALLQFKALHLRAPEHAVVCYELGNRLINKDDEAGVALLEQSMKIDHYYTSSVCSQLRDYFWKNGNKELAQSWHERLEARNDIIQQAQLERDLIRLNDDFEPHGLDESVISGIRAQLLEVSAVHKAYLFRKRVKHFPESPLYILAFSVTRFYQLHSSKRVKVAMDSLVTISVPDTTMMLNIDGDNYKFGRKAKKVGGSRIL